MGPSENLGSIGISLKKVSVEVLEINKAVILKGFLSFLECLLGGYEGD